MFLKYFEKIIIFSLIGMMVVIITLSTYELGYMLVRDIITSPYLLLDINDLLKIFGFILLIVIGIELLETIKAYLNEHVVHVEIVLEVALIAVARKVIIMDVKELDPLVLFGIATLVITLAAAYYLEQRHRRPK
jgi:uncharacterized membrane protein (DUF373 family)